MNINTFLSLRFQTYASVMRIFPLILLLLLIGCDAASEKSKSKSDSRTKSSATPGNGRLNDSKKILRVPMLSNGPRSLDPAEGSSIYDNQCVSQVYETLLQYKYLQRPFELEPLLLAEMPILADDGKTYHFKLKKDVRFQNDDCFPGGKGRALVTDDIFYSWKRIADPKIASGSNWRLLKDLIVGLDEAHQTALASGKFDYRAEIAGLQKINDHEFNVSIVAAGPRFLWTLAKFQMSIVAREAVEKYGSQFSAHPVGTGPFIVREPDWEPNKSIIMSRNSDYHGSWTTEFPQTVAKKEGGKPVDAGQRLPRVDQIETVFYRDSQTMWLDFLSHKLGFTTVPATAYAEAFDASTRTLKSEFAQTGITSQSVDLLDFIFVGFNMEDELLGGYSEEKRNLRRAISLAIDWEQQNQKFYDGSCTLYDGMIPPGLAGYPESGWLTAAPRGSNLEQAKAWLKSAGYPGGKNLPAIEYHCASLEPGQEIAQLTATQLARIGIKLVPQPTEFGAFMKKVDEKKAPLFAFSWRSDYPDAENNLGLFYGPNQSPGPNHFNYHNEEFDRLFEQARAMQAGQERTKLYEQMRDIVVADCPFAGSMSRSRQYLVNPELKNFNAAEEFQNWYKYLDVE